MKKKWHSLPYPEIFFSLKSTKSGLTSSQAIQRLKEYGLNSLPEKKPPSKLIIFLRQFNNPLVYILLVAIIISFFLKHYSDSLFIIIVLLINTTVGFYQENKANNSLAALKKVIKIRARVLRDNHEKEINAEELVPGDIVFLKAGDKVPADGRILEARGLKINEASLTGEALAVEKEPLDFLPPDTSLPDQKNMVFMGTIVEEGEGVFIVTGTGLNTEIGEVFSLLKKTKEPRTPLQKKISSLSQWVGLFILSIIAVIIIEGCFTEKNFAEILAASLALAVSAIPEGLLPAITVVLVLGMRRILARKGLVRKLAAIETLGEVTVICTDKTGTLTEGKMQVSHILTGSQQLALDNTFNNSANEKSFNSTQSHILILKIATLVNEAFIENPDDELQRWVVRGTPTEKALLLAGIQAGLNKEELEKRYLLLDKITFSSDYKYTARLYQVNKNKKVLYVMGAPEEIISRSLDIDIDGKKIKIGTLESEKLIKKLELLTAKGLRIIACAYRNFNGQKKYKNLSEIVNNLTLIGFITLKDPLRKEAKEYIEITKKAGIRTVIITGDHRLTAKAIAKEIGIDSRDENIIEGKDLENMSEEELKEKAKFISIYARVTPKHKLKIVEALQANNEIVAMVGDGVNDAPALKTADIGVAVGSGTEVAKEVSDLVLLDENFKTIVKAIEQGRVIFENIRKVFIYLVADDFSEIYLFLVSMAFGLPLPLLPAQILWINLIEDGFPDIALTTEQEIKGIMEQKPRNPKESILNEPTRKWMASIFFISGIAAFLTFYLCWKITNDLNLTRTIVFALMCLDSLIFALSVRSLKQPLFRKDIFSNRYLAAAILVSFLLLAAALYFPPFQKLLATQPLTITHWITIILITLVEIIIIEKLKIKFFVSQNK